MRVPRLALYGAASTLLAGGVVVSALQSRANFFAAAVAVGRSSGSLMVLANFALFNAICIGMAFKKVFFGQLRSIEYEHLFERLWMFVTESLLALTIFRRDFSAAFVLMYGLLLFLKCFHWITADRIDYMDQVPPPGPPFTFHLRAVSVLSILYIADAVLVLYCLDAIMTNGVSAMVLFASEFMILLASISGTTARYVVSLIDLRRARGRADAPTWEQKSMYMFYIDLVGDFCKLLTYLAFFTVIFLHYGLPLHVLRDVYMTLRSFLARCSDLVRYRRATRDMDALYPDATSEEMERLGDRTCIICREELVIRQEGDESNGDGPNDTPKKLVCGHVFHFHCLRSWLERQQSCPTCRRDVLRQTPNAPRNAAAAATPAAPAPGAVPQPPNHPTNGAAEHQNPNRAMQNAYNQFFRSGATGQPAHAGASNTADGGQAQSGAAVQLQTGIWGGPITPGQFFPTPLGAVPRNGTFPRNNISRPSALSSNLDSSSGAAGPSTAPTVPTLPNAAAANGDIPAASETTSVPDEQPPKPSNSEEENGNDSIEGPPLLRARRAAAEAAMRRMGGGPATASPSTSALTPTPTTPQADSHPTSRTSQEDHMRRDQNAADVKGKGKATNAVETFDDPPKYLPFLSNGLPPPHPSPSLPWLNSLHNISRPSPGSNLLDPSGQNGIARRWNTAGSGALDDRLKVLRDVDEVIWGLVGELTKVKSRWEAEIGNSTEDGTSLAQSLSTDLSEKGTSAAVEQDRHDS